MPGVDVMDKLGWRWRRRGGGEEDTVGNVTPLIIVGDEPGGDRQTARLTRALLAREDQYWLTGPTFITHPFLP